MCVQPISKKSKFNTHFLIYTAMILFGIVSGLSHIGFLENLGLTLSDIFIKIFKCISLPIISLSIIVTLSNYSAEQAMKKIWQKTLTYTIGTTIVAAIVSSLLYLIIHPSNVNSIAETTLTPQNKIDYLQHISSLIPTNLFAPFLEHQVMGVLLISIVVGIALRFIPDEAAKQSVIQLFKGLHGLFLVITRWVVAIIPLGLYGFTTATVIQLRNGMHLGGIGEYLAVAVMANFIQAFIILPAWLRFNGIKPFSTMRKMMPALSLAFFSKSSAGTLPVTMETAEKQLNINPKISRLILPLCTSINMNGCAIFIFSTVIYLMQNHGVPITLWTMASWIIIATIAAIGNAGVPMGCFFLSTSLLASMNIPITLLGVILPFYSILDMIETALNVWSDSCVTTVIDKQMRHASQIESEVIELSQSAIES